MNLKTSKESRIIQEYNDMRDASNTLLIIYDKCRKNKLYDISDCKKCINCLDKPRYGGIGKRKKACINPKIKMTNI